MQTASCKKIGGISFLIFLSAFCFLPAIGAHGQVVGWGDNYYSEATPPADLTNAVAISVGLDVSLGLRSDGTVTAWGDGSFYENTVPADATNVVAIGSGWFYHLVLKADGTVVQWGNQSYQQFYGYPPADTNLLSIATWGYHALGLKSDGTVIAWGNNGAGQATVPAGLSNVIAIATGETHSLALKGDGTVVCWGDNSAGQCNVPAGLSNVVAIAGGGWGYKSSVALKSDGTVAAWGNNSPGQLNVSPCLTNIVAITYNLALRSDGAILTWPNQCDPLTNASSVMALASGPSHTLAIVGAQAPQIFQEPVGLTVLAEGTALFKVSALGSVPLSYQWQLNGTNVPGATASTLLLTDVQPAQAGQYSVIVSNSLGAVTSSNALLNVLAEFITSQPTNQTVYGGDNATLAVAAQGAGLNYQWQFSGTNLPGQTNSQLIINIATTNNAGSYSVIVSNSYDWVASSNATLTVVPIAFATQPTNLNLYVGDSATFSVAAVKNGPFTYQWRFGGTDISGATNASLTLNNLTNLNTGNYSVFVTNPYGSLETSPASLNVVNSKPIIFTQPASQGAYPGSSVSFQVVADGTKPLSYQWLFNGTNILNATNSTLILTNLAYANSGSYSLRVSNAVDSVLSSKATLTLLSVVTWGQTNSYGLANIPLDLTNVIAIAAGNNHSVALKSTGKVAVWGDNTYGQTNVPANLSNVVAIAAASYHTLALKSNGIVVSWGDMTSVPASLTNVAAVAAGDNFNLALKSDGTVVAWGASGSATNVPAGLVNVVAIGAGGSFGATARGDGTFTEWAYNSAPSTPTGMTNVVAIGACEFPLVALRANGTVAASGVGAPPASLTNAVAVSANRYNAMALRADGTVTNWPTGGPVTPANLTNVSAIASGQYICLAITGGGAPFVAVALVNRTVAPGATAFFYAPATGAWPMAYQWQCNGTNVPGATNLILALTNALPGASGSYSVVVTNDFGSITSSVAVLTVPDFSSALDTTGLVWTTTGSAPWFMETNVTEYGLSALQSGAITNNQTTTVQTTVTGPGTLTFWWKLVSSSSDAALLFKIGNSVQASLYGSGNPTLNTNWQQQTFYLAAGTQTLQWIFSKDGNNSAAGSAFLDEVTFTAGATAPIFSSLPVSQSQAPDLSVTLSGAATGTPPLSYQWLGNGTNISGATGTSLTITNLQTSNIGTYSLVVSNVAGTTNADATIELGQVAAWGDNGYGQITVPTGMTNIIAVAAGYLHSLALRADGTVVAWGDNSAGESSIPPSATNVVSISAGYNFSAVLKADGEVIVWGYDAEGQTNMPSGLTNVVAIATGWYQTLALLSDGTIVTWGYVGTNVPAGLSNVVAVAGGAFHNLALTADGTVVGWGSDNYGVLDFPAGLTNIIGIAAGYFNCSAIRADGSMITWGDTSYGQTNIPNALTNVLSIGKGVQHNLAVTTSGVIMPADTNLTVPALWTNGVMASSGLYHSLALLGNAPPLLQAPASNVASSANSFCFSLPTQSGRVYALEYKNTLSDTNWTTLSLTGGNGNVLTLTDSSATNSQRFYRVRRW
ncbi:MAG: immunoglobulin domain-containing protein [Verrucomicrobiota bacterium]|jgi:alpha-tubulin suppressor-like RCC1 family protein